MNKEPDRNPRRALGKGLSALLPSRGKPTVEPAAERVSDEPATPTATHPSLPERFEDFQSIPLDRIVASAEQPRDAFDEERLQELSQSIKAHGVIQPITVTKLDRNQYQIIAGERRWRAAKLAGLAEIPALVRAAEQDDLLELALIENIQREDLNPIEVALAFQRLTTQHGLSHEQLAERTGKDRSTVTNFLRLLKLSPYVRNELIAGRISMGHARALLNVTDPEQQAAYCKDIVAKQLSVRDTEGLVKNPTQRAGRSPQITEKKALAETPDPNIRAALDDISMALGTKVRLIARSESTGRLEIEYYSSDDLDRIYAVIVKK